MEAAKKGYSQVLWLFGKENYVTEVGTMSDRSLVLATMTISITITKCFDHWFSPSRPSPSPSAMFCVQEHVLLPQDT